MTAPHFDSEHATLWHGDCIDIMRTLPDASVDAVVTDPPYNLTAGKKGGTGSASINLDSPYGRSRIGTGNGGGGFMGKGWDDYDSYVREDGTPGSFQHWCEDWAREAYRLLKPGGHLLAFGGTRTHHRLASGIEDAGFEIRDSIAWLYGSGFPKSLDVSKAIDKQLGTEGTYGEPKSAAHAGWIDRGRMRGAESEGNDGWQRPSTNDPAAVDQRARKYEGGTDAARDWQGWGTALKPAFEPVVVARKPLSGTVAQNVLAHGTGALNIDASRIGNPEDKKHPGTRTYQRFDIGSPVKETQVVPPYTSGRWPANVILDEHTAPLLDAQSGITRDGVAVTRNIAGKPFPGEVYGLGGSMKYSGTDVGYGGQGGASRFFYTAKASTDERPSVDGIVHPTVKPVDLMRWLVRLVTPKGGTVLEPFAGSGTTVEAAVLEGFRCIAIEREADYLPLIMQRISKPHAVGLDFGDWEDAS